MLLNAFGLLVYGLLGGTINKSSSASYEASLIPTTLEPVRRNDLGPRFGLIIGLNISIRFSTVSLNLVNKF